MKLEFIPIDWNIERNDSYVSINPIEKENIKKSSNSECCQKSTLGCNLAACKCDFTKGLNIKVLDKHHNVIAETNWHGEIKRIIIDKDRLNNPVIKVE